MDKTAKTPPFVLAADIGGTHITSAVVDRGTYRIVPHTMVRNTLNSLGSAKSILQAWADTLKASQERFSSSLLAVGIAMPGPFDYEKGISLIQGQDKYDSLYGVCVKEELAAALGVAKSSIGMINDAAAFLQGEVFAGGYDTKEKVLGITLGTGLGSAIWTQNQHSKDAALWNTPYQDSIMEEFLATRWFVEQAKQHLGGQVDGLRELLELDGHVSVKGKILNNYSEHLLHFLHFFSERESCQNFIIGGNIAKAWLRIRENYCREFDQFDIQISQLGEHAALIGAATLF